MSYFQQFPQQLVTINRKPIVVTDLFRRLAINTRFNDVTAVLLPYFVLDGETPEMVSNKLYGTPFYHWVILHANNIVDPREEWPLEDRYVVPMIFEKYDFSVLIDNPLVYQVGDKVTSSDGGKFVITDIVGMRIMLRSTVGLTYITTSTLLSIVTPGRELTGLRVNQVTDPLEATHHYINETTGYVVDRDDANVAVVPVSNFDFEQTTNDNKRTIRALDPQYLGSFVRTFEQMVSA